MMLCDATSPGMSGGVYHQSYIEAVEGKDHAYATKHQCVTWTRSMTHPEDPRCPVCNRRESGNP